VATVKSGQVVAGLTGVHITYETDRVQVLQPLPELELRAGDMIMRYMYRGEGFADIWAKGQWRREYDCTFITDQFDCMDSLGGDSKCDNLDSPLSPGEERTAHPGAE